jgi:hypothetical protein
MDCETATPLIEALCDDELDVATAARLVAHLEACGACAALRREAETRMTALREARGVDKLPEEVRARVAREVARSAAPRRFPRAAAAVAAVAAIVLAVLAVASARSVAPPGRLAVAGAPVVRELTGEVFCLRCALARLFPGTPVLDPRHLPVLRTADGEVVTLLDGEVTRAELSRKGCAGRRVAVAVRLFPDQDIAEVLSVRVLGPASGLPSRDGGAAAASRAGASRR